MRSESLSSTRRTGGTFRRARAARAGQRSQPAGTPARRPSSWMSASALVCCWISFFTRSSSSSDFWRSAADGGPLCRVVAGREVRGEAVDAALQRVGEDLRPRQRLARGLDARRATSASSLASGGAVAGAAGCRPVDWPALGAGCRGACWRRAPPGRGGRSRPRGPGSGRRRGAAGAETSRLGLQLVVRVGLAGRLHGLAPFGFLARHLAQRLGAERASRAHRHDEQGQDTHRSPVSAVGRPRTAITGRRPGAPATTRTRSPPCATGVGSLHHALQLASAAPGPQATARSSDRAGAGILGLPASATGGPPSRQRVGVVFGWSRPRPRPRRSRAERLHIIAQQVRRACPTRTPSSAGCCCPRDGPPSSASGGRPAHDGAPHSSQRCLAVEIDRGAAGAPPAVGAVEERGGDRAGERAVPGRERRQLGRPPSRPPPRPAPASARPRGRCRDVGFDASWSEPACERPA